MSRVAELKTTFSPDFNLKPPAFLKQIMARVKTLNRNDFPQNSKFFDKVFSKSEPSPGFLLVKAIKRAVKLTTSNFTKKEPFIIPNLIILGQCVYLRNKTKELDHVRFMFNLNQLWLNVERRMFFEDWYVQVSKFKMMKLTSIVLGRVVNNVIEMVVNPSLIPYGKIESTFYNHIAVAQKYPANNSIPPEERVNINVRS